MRLRKLVLVLAIFAIAITFSPRTADAEMVCYAGMIIHAPEGWDECFPANTGPCQYCEVVGGDTQK